MIWPGHACASAFDHEHPSQGRRRGSTASRARWRGWISRSKFRALLYLPSFRVGLNTGGISISTLRRDRRFQQSSLKSSIHISACSWAIGINVVIHAHPALYRVGGEDLIKSGCAGEDAPASRRASNVTNWNGSGGLVVADQIQMIRHSFSFELQPDFAAWSVSSKKAIRNSASRQPRLSSRELRDSREQNAGILVQRSPPRYPTSHWSSKFPTAVGSFPRSELALSSHLVQYLQRIAFSFGNAFTSSGSPITTWQRNDHSAWR